VTIKSLALNNGCLSMVNTIYRRMRKQHNCVQNDHNTINFIYACKILLKYECKLRGMNTVIGLNIAYNYRLTVDLLQSKLFILIQFTGYVNALIVQTRLVIKSNWGYYFFVLYPSSHSRTTEFSTK
jgi:hypothetical protein